MATLFAEHYQAVDSSGDPISGALLHFYQTGTTTEITTYQDSAEATPHANPVVADSSGRFAPIYVTSFGFKIVLADADDSTIQTVDPVNGGLLATGDVQMWVSAEDWIPTITNGAQAYLAEEGTNDVMTYGLAYDQTTEEYATWSFVLPKRWDGGTVTFTPHWMTNAGGSSETVDWAFAGVSIGNDDALDAAPGTAVTSTDTWIADGDLHIGPATAAITITAAAAGERVTFKVYRDVSEDDLGGDAIFLGAMLTFTADQANDA